MPTELLTGESLATQAGMVAAVMLLVFFAKWAFGIEGPRARYVAFVWALIIVLAVMISQGTVSLALAPDALMIALILWLSNAMFITLVAMGAYEVKKQLQSGYGQEQDPRPPTYKIG